MSEGVERSAAPDPAQDETREAESRLAEQTRLLVFEEGREP
jgi:hypothetical protein